MSESITPSISGDCLGRTCLKWSCDGELTALDLGLVLERLAKVDLEMSSLSLENVDSLPSHSVC